MKSLLTALKLVVALGLVSASGYVLYQQAVPLLTPPCSKPILYTIGTYDSRFNISESQFKLALAHAANVWNTEAGKTLILSASGNEKGMSINLVYSDIQKATELGKNIDAEQNAYDLKKAEVNAIRNSFNDTKSAYERKSASYAIKAKAYQAEVDSWNAKGGAPPDVYQSLKAQGASLERDRKALNAEADSVNELAKQINTAVGQLNALAQKLNSKVNTYNKKAGANFEQGHYVEDENGKYIDVYELKNEADLERVLAHEFGHALGMGHVQNPDSVMYSFNIGEGLDLTDEDKAELHTVCKIN